MSDSEFLFDSNVWVALVFDAHPAHELVMEVFASASKDRQACFCRSTQHSFFRLVTTPALQRAYEVTLTNADALRTFDQLMSNPAIVFRDEPDEITDLWPAIAKLNTPSPKVWMDAYLAAFSITIGAEFITLDRDFVAHQSSGLKLRLLQV